MTRYTNLGRKRTHLDAEETTPALGIDLEKEAEPQAEASNRPEKKQRRSKGKGERPDGVDGGTPGPSGNEEGNVQVESKNVGRSTTKKPAKATWKGMGQGPTYLFYVLWLNSCIF